MYQWIHMDAQDDINAAKCLWCLLMHTLCLDAPKQLYGWSRWPFMHLDVFDVYCCRSCVFIIYAPRDLYGCSRWIILTLKMTQDTTGCLRCLSMHKLRLDAPRDSYWCSRWPLMQLNFFNAYQCTSCASMHQNNYIDNPCIWMSDVYWCRSCVFVHQGLYMDGQDDPWCSQMSINA